MENIRERIQEITEQGLSNRETTDALLRLDAENVDLGSCFTKTEKERMKTNSRIIVRAIKPYDEETYNILSKGFDT